MRAWPVLQRQRFYQRQPRLLARFYMPPRFRHPHPHGRHHGLPVSSRVSVRCRCYGARKLQCWVIPALGGPVHVLALPRRVLLPIREHVFCRTVPCREVLCRKFELHAGLSGRNVHERYWHCQCRRLPSLSAWKVSILNYSARKLNITKAFVSWQLLGAWAEMSLLFRLTEVRMG